MKRRDFIIKGTAGALTAGVAGCGAAGLNKEEFKPGPAPFSFKVDMPKPAGTMPVGEIGTTGIKVSKLGFGSHIRKEIIKYFEERQKIIRESYDLGVTFFDVYDTEMECYQYEPMGKHLAPMINDVVISISIAPYDGRSFEQEFERDLRVFGRDHIDMVLIHSGNPDDPRWEKLFKLKEKGHIRAVGMPIHDPESLNKLLGVIPLDYVIFPYNFYHNVCWYGEKPDDFNPLVKELRKRNIGVVTMKPFAGDWLVTPFKKLAGQFSGKSGIRFPQAALKYIINSGIDADTTLAGMYSLNHVYENTASYYNPRMTDEEIKLLDTLRGVADKKAQAWLPDHYKWMGKWAPSQHDERNNDTA